MWKALFRGSTDKRRYKEIFFCLIAFESLYWIYLFCCCRSAVALFFLLSKKLSSFDFDYYLRNSGFMGSSRSSIPCWYQWAIYCETNVEMPSYYYGNQSDKLICNTQTRIYMHTHNICSSIKSVVLAKRYYQNPLKHCG